MMMITKLKSRIAVNNILVIDKHHFTKSRIGSLAKFFYSKFKNGTENLPIKSERTRGNPFEEIPKSSKQISNIEVVIL